MRIAISPVRSDEKFGFARSSVSSEMLQISAERGGDPTRIGKRDPLDALVWLHQRPNGAWIWPSPFGRGRPGWHMECCAIALNYFPIDGKATITSSTFKAAAVI